MFLTFLFLAKSDVFQIDRDLYMPINVLANNPFEFSINDPQYKAFFIFDEIYNQITIGVNLSWNNVTEISENVVSKAFSFDGSNGTLFSTSPFKFLLISTKKSVCPDLFSVYTADGQAVVKSTFNEKCQSYCIFPFSPSDSEIMARFDPIGKSRAFVHQNTTEMEITENIHPERPYFFYATNVDAEQSVTFSISGNKGSNPFSYVCSHYSGDRYVDGKLNNTDKTETQIQCERATSNTIWRYTAIALLCIALVIVLGFLIRWIVVKYKKFREEKLEKSIISSNTPISVNLNEPLINQSTPSYSDPSVDDGKSVVFFQRKQNV